VYQIFALFATDTYSNIKIIKQQIPAAQAQDVDVLCQVKTQYFVLFSPATKNDGKWKILQHFDKFLLTERGSLCIMDVALLPRGGRIQSTAEEKDLFRSAVE